MTKKSAENMELIFNDPVNLDFRANSYKKVFSHFFQTLSIQQFLFLHFSFLK